MKPERLAAMRLFTQVKPCGDHARDVLMLEIVAPMLTEALDEIERQGAAIKKMAARINEYRDASFTAHVPSVRVESSEPELESTLTYTDGNWPPPILISNGYRPR